MLLAVVSAALVAKDENSQLSGHGSVALTSMDPGLFIGSFTTDGEDALITLREKLPAGLKHFIAKYDDGIPVEVAEDARFEMRSNVVLNHVTHGNDALAIQFTRWDDLTREQKEQFEELGKQGRAVVREQKRSIVGHGLLKAREVERRVARSIPFIVNSHHFMRAWQIKNIRPTTGSANPERTDERYCVYDEFSSSYGYTEAWVQWLVRHCGTPKDFAETTGRNAQPKS